MGGEVVVEKTEGLCREEVKMDGQLRDMFRAAHASPFLLRCGIACVDPCTHHAALAPDPIHQTPSARNVECFFPDGLLFWGPANAPAVVGRLSSLHIPFFSPSVRLPSADREHRDTSLCQFRVRRQLNQQSRNRRQNPMQLPTSLSSCHIILAVVARLPGARGAATRHSYAVEIV